MKFHLASIFFFFMAMVISNSASPIAERDLAAPSLVHLAERHVTYPCKPDDTLVVDILAAIKAHLKVKVFAQITANFCEKLQANLEVKAKILGGIISIGELQIKAIQSAVIKNLKVRLDADLEADVDAKVYVPIKADIKALLGSTPLTKEELLKILVDIELKVQALVKVELPKIGVDLKAKVKEEIDISIKKAEVNIPLIAKVDINAKIDEAATLDACVKVAIEACVALDAKAEALLILQGL
ncbi:hypothetical protein BY458DRAFT_502186 [Sporodiniella umbellata]|nr:hypothetical protein BY458DRAFT_502186 [Sporodiniella umbellata]